MSHFASRPRAAFARRPFGRPLDHPYTLFAACLFAAGNAAAASDEIVVSATRAERPASEVGSAVTVIDAAEIAARQYALVADALRDAAGVAVARNGVFGGFSGVRIRGATSGQTLVAIDGVVMNDPAAPQGGFNFASLDVDDIARIEILHGPQSLLYGADAIGGVVAITTRTDEGARGFIEGGAHGLVRGGASVGVSSAAAFARASVSGVRAGGISRAASGTEDDGYRSLAASVRAGAEISSDFKAEATARFADARAEIDGFPPPAFTLGDTEETEDTREWLFSGRLLHGGFDDAPARFSGAAALSWSAIDRANADAGSPTFSAKGDRLAADYIGDFRFSDRFSLVAGAEIERTSAIVSGVDDRADAAGVFALLEARLASNLTLSAGGRRDEFSNFRGATTARAALTWRAANRTTVRASWGEGFRAPTLFELNFDQFGIVPNPDLRPERATGFDAGVEHAFGDGQSPAAVLKATFFHSRVIDQIDFDFAGNGYFNIDRTRSRGAEIEAEFGPARGVSASLAYTFLDAVDRATGARLVRLPRHKATLVVAYAPTPRLSLSSSVIVNGREADAPAPNPAFMRIDLRGAYTISDALEAYARIENATDETYQDVSGYGEPGISAIGGVRVRL